MAEWNHNICGECWYRLNPGRRPITITDARKDICCYCAQPNTRGVYVRVDPRDEKLLCKGVHDPEVELE